MPLIRNVAVGLPIRAGHVLVSRGADSVTGEAFYRAIGGGIEFGETAETAVRREFTEELGVSLGEVRLLDVLEDIFVYEGTPGHQIVHVFAVDATDIDKVPLEAELHVLDEGDPVRWVSIAEADQPFYPTGIARILKSSGQ